MPKIAYRANTLRKASLDIVATANSIIGEYARDNMRITLRQLYYQFVARGLLANKVENYKMLGELITKARYAGLVDWNAIEDRTRNLRVVPSWDDPADAIKAIRDQYKNHVWDRQPYAPELWVEKEALAGVIARTANRMRIGYMACKGYMSASEMWAAAQRFGRYVEDGRKPIIFHLGDHDPSGVDMSRDIEERTREFLAAHGLDDFQFERIALNMDQVRQYNPPPNPAKETDARCKAYKELYGDESWELDALEPRLLDNLMETSVIGVRDEGLWLDAMREEKEERDRISWVKDHWQALSDQAQEDIDNGDYDPDADEDED